MSTVEEDSDSYSDSDEGGPTWYDRAVEELARVPNDEVMAALDRISDWEPYMDDDEYARWERVRRRRLRQVRRENMAGLSAEQIRRVEAAHRRYDRRRARMNRHRHEHYQWVDSFMQIVRAAIDAENAERAEEVRARLRDPDPEEYNERRQRPRLGAPNTKRKPTAEEIREMVRRAGREVEEEVKRFSEQMAEFTRGFYPGRRAPSPEELLNIIARKERLRKKERRARMRERERDRPAPQPARAPRTSRPRSELDPELLDRFRENFSISGVHARDRDDAEADAPRRQRARMDIQEEPLSCPGRTRKSYHYPSSL